MTKRLQDFAKKDDAVIEVFSEILLTGIIVLAIAAVAAFVLSSLDGPDNVRVDIDHWVDKDTDTLYFRHSGGETVDVENLELVVNVNGSYETLTSEQIRANYDSDEWALGDVIEINTSTQFNYDITDDRVPTKLVHTASSLVIYDAYGSIGDSGAGGGGSGPQNQPPVASFSYSPSSPVVDQDITFDASNSSDSDGSITDYVWDWTNDGSYDATGVSATHSYSSPGSYDVKLRVTDDEGNTNSTMKTVNVAGFLRYNDDAIADDGPDNPSPDKAGGVYFSIQNLYGSTVTIDSIKINPANDDIVYLSDDIAPNDNKKYVEVYAESDIDGYSEFYSGIEIPTGGLEVAIGQDGDETNGVSPQVNSNNVMTFYVYEFYEPTGGSGKIKNINMQGEDVEITINYTVESDQKSKTFTITP
jgi:PKD repeat protein